MKFIVATLMLAALPACAPIYTPPTSWTYDAPKEDGDFEPDMTECVQYFDRAHLHDLDNGGAYQVSGLFVDTSRTEGVVGCMEAKGWNPEQWDNNNLD
jgi:hypothetical protein